MIFYYRSLSAIFPLAPSLSMFPFGGGVEISFFSSALTVRSRFRFDHHVLRGAAVFRVLHFSFFGTAF